MDRAAVKRLVLRSIGGGLGIGLMGLLADLAQEPLVLVPFATSIVLVMATPESPQAQPRNILGGHLISAGLGVACVLVLGSNFWVSSLAVTLSIGVMLALDALHPPAGINPVIIVTQHTTASFIYFPVGVGALLLLLYAFSYHGLTGDARWPKKWF